MFAEVMTSSDGGWSWTEQRPPSGVLGLAAVDCPSLSRCYATGLALLPPKQQTQLTNDIAVVLESVDGGRHWRRVGAAPGLVYLNAISCPTIATCFAAGDTVTGEDGSSDAVVVTTNGGARWHEEAVPAEQSGILLSDISCPSVSNCWVGGGSGLLATTDGGLTWQQLDSGWVDSLSCPSVRHCVAMGVSGGEGWELVGTGLRYHFVTGSAPAFQPDSSEVCPSATLCIAWDRRARRFRVRRLSSAATEVAAGRTCPFHPWSPQRRVSRRRQRTSRGHSRSVIHRPTPRSPVRPSDTASCSVVALTRRSRRVVEPRSNRARRQR